MMIAIDARISSVKPGSMFPTSAAIRLVAKPCFQLLGTLSYVNHVPLSCHYVIIGIIVLFENYDNNTA